MTTAIDILKDGFTRIAEDLPTALDGLSVDDLLWQPSPGANHIAWLAWHIGRCEDAQIAQIGGTMPVYCDHWEQRFGLPYDADETGYGQTAAQVKAFRLTEPTLLTDYYAAVHEATEAILNSLDGNDLAKIVDQTYQTTAAVRLVSIVNDITQHMGQIGYLRGLISKEH